MRLTDTILFQASLEPERFALVGPGAVVPYGRIAQALLSAERRLLESGFREGARVALSIANPLDHVVFCLALHRARITAVHPHNGAVTGRLDGVLTDAPNVQFGIRHPNARMVIVEQGWLQGEGQVNLADRSRAVRAPHFVYEANGGEETTSGELEAQIDACLLSAPADWERLILLHAPQSAAARRHVFMALAMGRTVCFAEAANVRQLASAYRHHYLVGAWSDLVEVARAQAENFIPVPSLRGLLAEVEQTPAAEEAALVSRLSPNGRIAWSDPRMGVVGVAEIADFLAGRLGAAGPWAEVRLSGGALAARLKAAPGRSAAWIKTALPIRLAS